MTFEDEFLPRTDDLLLALFTIGNLSVDGDIMSTQAMKMSVRLDTLVLDDMRPIEEHEGLLLSVLKINLFRHHCLYFCKSRSSFIVIQSLCY